MRLCPMNKPYYIIMSRAIDNLRRSIENDEKGIRQALENDSWETDTIVAVRKRIQGYRDWMARLMKQLEEEKGITE